MYILPIHSPPPPGAHTWALLTMALAFWAYWRVDMDSE